MTSPGDLRTRKILALVANINPHFSMAEVAKYFTLFPNFWWAEVTKYSRLKLLKILHCFEISGGLFHYVFIEYYVLTSFITRKKI